MNKYCFFRVEKVHSTGISGLQQHNQQSEKHIEFLASRNENFNPQHLHLNNHLVKSEGFRTDINNLIEKYNIKKVRKDAVKLLDAIVTYSPEVTKHLCCYLNQNNKAWLEIGDHQKWMEEYNAIPEEERNELVKNEKEWADDYFQAALKWYEKYYGIVISAEVHFTESTPHLHINSVPILEGKESGEYRLCAKEIFGNAKKMSQMQTKFAEEVGLGYGLERGIEKKPDEGFKKRKTKNQWEIEQEEKKLQETVKNARKFKQVEDTYKERAKASESAYNALIKGQEEKYKGFLEYTDKQDELEANLSDLEQKTDTMQNNYNETKNLVNEQLKDMADIAEVNRHIEKGKSLSIKTDYSYKESFEMVMSFLKQKFPVAYNMVEKLLNKQRNMEQTVNKLKETTNRLQEIEEDFER